MAALNRLEEIVGVPPGALAALVGPRRARGRRVYTEAPNLAELYSDWDSIAGLLSEFDTGSDDVLVRLSQYERLKLGPDGTLRELYSRALVRAAANDVTSSIVIDQATEGNAPLIRPLRGCALGTVRTRPEAGLTIAELRLPRPLQRGEPHVMEYVVEFTPPNPSDRDRACAIGVDLDPCVLANPLEVARAAVRARQPGHRHPTRAAGKVQRVRRSEAGQETEQGQSSGFRTVSSEQQAQYLRNGPS